MQFADKNDIHSPIGPFLRWTGSKRWFIKDHIDKFLPKKFNDYHEPFLGGGAVFFYLKGQVSMNNRNYFLSDSNGDLINCYLQIRDNLEDVVKHLSKFKNTEDSYYRIRELTPQSLEKKAARFIFLNRTSFNGIYRVNSQGKYNVPYGKRTKVDIVTNDLLEATRRLLQSVDIKEQSFENTIENIKEKDLVFIDPPYTVAHENNGFIEYNKKLFSWEDQEKLKEYIKQIIQRKAYFILTNASHYSIHNLYANIASITTVSRESRVGGRNKTRCIYNELVICNSI